MQGSESTLRRDDVLSDGAIILPSQYFGSIGSVGLSAEQRLMLAVLVDAINVLQTRHDGGSTCKRRNFAEAAQWVNTQGSRYLFSFDGVCDALEIDSELLRSRLACIDQPLGQFGQPHLARTPAIQKNDPQPAYERQSIAAA